MVIEGLSSVNELEKSLSHMSSDLNRGQCRGSELWVCWIKPRRLPFDETPILSFLPPSVEETISREHFGPIIRGREASTAIRSEARMLYLDVVAEIGTAPYGKAQTLRQALARPGEASRWWYHPVAFKGCESDPAFNWIIAVCTIRDVAKRLGLKKLVLVGAPREIAVVLKRAFAVEEWKTRHARPIWWIWLRSVASRLLYVTTMLRQISVVRRELEIPKGSFDVVFSGFWDWSVSLDDQTQSLSDRYFKFLPDKLKQEGLTGIGWFCWFAPHAEPGSKDRRLRDVLDKAKGRHDVVILQSFLRPGDIIRAAGDFRPLITFLKVRQQSTFKKIFHVGELDYYPLFSGQLLRGFLDANLPLCELVALATERACRHYEPKVALTFLEHFPYSRAYYEGVGRAGSAITRYAVQHASYNSEKTFLFLHPTLEFKGEPDGCAVPHPDYVCTMGTLGQDLFLECGYSKEQVLLTGSPRYDYTLSLSSGDEAPVSDGDHGRIREDEAIQLLLVLSLHLDTEIEMIDAVCSAVDGLSGIKVFYRNHPFTRIEEHPGFEKYKDCVELTCGALEEDLTQADLVLFTYSTVAEEALIGGKPVWQWLPVGFNGSALAEVVAIPQFGSVTRLRKTLQDFIADPSHFTPGSETRRLAFERLFYLGDEGAAKRIANVIRKLPSLMADGTECEVPIPN